MIYRLRAPFSTRDPSGVELAFPEGTEIKIAKGPSPGEWVLVDVARQDTLVRLGEVAELHPWLERHAVPKGYDQNVVHYSNEAPSLPAAFLSASLRGTMSTADLVKAECYAESSVTRALLSRAVEPVHWIRDEDYRLETSVQHGAIVLVRNEASCVLRTHDLFVDAERVDIRYGWNPDMLMVGVRVGDRSKMMWTATAPTMPPPRLVRRVRDRNLLPTIDYPAEEDLRARIHAGLGSLGEKLKATDAYTSFWDTHYDGNRIVKREPKREVDVQRTIHLALDDFAAVAGIEVTPSPRTGSGNVDFLFQGTIRDLGIRSVCAEFKNAHSPDLEHGLAVQLPDYMESMAARFGVYVVLCYEGSWFKGPSGSAPPALLQRLGAVVESLPSRFGSNIRFFVLLLEKPSSPSQVR